MITIVSYCKKSNFVDCKVGFEMFVFIGKRTKWLIVEFAIHNIGYVRFITRIFLWMELSDGIT